MKHDCIQFALPNGALFSIVCIDDRREVAVLGEGGFVPVPTWHPEADDYCSLTGDVLRVGRSTEDLAEALAQARAWATACVSA